MSAHTAVRSAAEQHCRRCGHAWRWLVSGQDAFSLILAHEIHATAPVKDEHEPVRGVFRAARFVVHLPLRYRVAGRGTWGVGMTENISRSGILFRTDPPPAMREALTAKPALDMTLKLPQEDPARPPVHVRCQGGVVRATWSDRRGRPSAWAITVGDYILHAH